MLMLSCSLLTFFYETFIAKFSTKNISSSSAIGEKLRKENFWSDCTYKPNKCTISIALGK